MWGWRESWLQAVLMVRTLAARIAVVENIEWEAKVQKLRVHSLPKKVAVYLCVCVCVVSACLCVRVCS
jgi:hypothetical protein